MKSNCKELAQYLIYCNQSANVSIEISIHLCASESTQGDHEAPDPGVFAGYALYGGDLHTSHGQYPHRPHSCHLPGEPQSSGQ